MSRTYRKRMVSICGTCLKPVYCTITKKFNDDICTCEDEQDHFAHRNRHYVEMLVHDDKHWMNPPKDFKKKRRRQERAQIKEALHEHVYKGKEFTPPVVNRNGDQWDWV